jgi:virulence-associated protein VagC
MTQLAKVFQNGRSQAIRIPKEFRVDTAEVIMSPFVKTKSKFFFIPPLKLPHVASL